jgi:uncharacterized protein with HEPN domain
MTDRLATHLESIRRAASNAIDFTDGMSLDVFMEDAKTQAAAAMCLIVIGESASRILVDAPDFVATRPAWPWEQMRGMRNRIAHGYDTLNLPIIWSTVTEFVPGLLSAVVAGLSANDPPQIAT